MKQTSSSATINDLLHAVVVIASFAVSVYGLSDELFEFHSQQVIAVVAYALAVGAIVYAAVLAQPPLAAVRALTRRRSEPRTTSL
ncbi:MAG TPA: hypothetical protein VJU53_01995 [Burkholderiaceae bacterium]|nr:hypothetical protein [Burkholderiaceae bacterium]